MKNIDLQNLAYNILKVLSHSKNLKTNNQIAEDHERQDRYDPHSQDKFLEFMEKYLINYKCKSVIDIGCGTGDLSIKLAKSGARRVIGIDIDRDRIFSARRNAIIEGVENIVEFECIDFVKEYKATENFDIAFNKAAFEHILSPLETLKKIYSCLTRNGILGTLFGPLWLSPYGAHLSEFTIVPWVHLFFPEKAVLRVRTECYRPDEHVERYEDIRGHLNRITVKKFRRYSVEAGFDVSKFRLNPGLDNWDRGTYKMVNILINAIPLLQELGSFQLLAILKKHDS